MRQMLDSFRSRLARPAERRAAFAQGQPARKRCSRRLASRAAWHLLTLVTLAQVAIAQPPPPPAAPVVTATRSWYLDAFLVVAVSGLALFAVCRSSRRN